MILAPTVGDDPTDDDELVDSYGNLVDGKDVVRQGRRTYSMYS